MGNSTTKCENCHIHTVGGCFHCNHHICSIFASLLNFLNAIVQVAYSLLKKLKFFVKVNLLLLDLFLFVDFFDKGIIFISHNESYFNGVDLYIF